MGRIKEKLQTIWINVVIALYAAAPVGISILCLGVARWQGLLGSDWSAAPYVLGGAALINVPYGLILMRRLGRGGPYDFSGVFAYVLLVFMEAFYILGFLAFLLLNFLA